MRTESKEKYLGHAEVGTNNDQAQISVFFYMVSHRLSNFPLQNLCKNIHYLKMILL